MVCVTWKYLDYKEYFPWNHILENKSYFYIYLLTTKNTRKKVLDFDALTLVNISQEVILLPGFKVQ